MNCRIVRKWNTNKTEQVTNTCNTAGESTRRVEWKRTDVNEYHPSCASYINFKNKQD